MDNHHITLRPIRLPEDLDFLLAIYTSVRWEELAPVPWTDEQKLGFLAQQFATQHQQYMARYVGAEFSVVECDGETAGRLYVMENATDVRVVDISLLPAWRGKGIGSHLLGQVTDRAARAGKTVSIHVEKTNPAMRLYHRLGFNKLADADIYDLMEWRPAA